MTRIKINLLDPESFKGSSWIAAMDFNPGDMLLEEAPVFYGPGLNPHSTLCVSCNFEIDPHVINLCSSCNLLVCNHECEKNPVHANNECKVFASSQSNYEYCPSDAYQLSMSILMLRGAALKSTNPQLYHKIMRFSNNTKQHYDQDTESFNVSLENQAKSVLSWLKSLLKQASLEFSDDVYIKIFKLFRQSGFSCEECCPPIVSQEPKSNDETRSRTNHTYAVYHHSNHVTYSCVPNCTWSMCPEKGFRIRLRASVPIKKKDKITVAWDPLTSSFKGTLERQRIIQERYGTKCDCVQCKDTTELELHLSSLVCTSADCLEHVSVIDGFRCGYYLPQGPSIQSQMWKCNKCLHQMNEALIIGIASAMEETFEDIFKNHEDPCERIELVTDTMECMVKNDAHRNHFVFAQVISKLLKEFRSLEVLTKEQSDLQIAYIKYLLSLRDVMSPGLSSNRMHLLKELSAALMKRLQNFGFDSDKTKIEEIITDFIQLLKASREAFEYYMLDFCRPGEDCNFNATESFSMMKNACSGWGIAVLKSSKLGKEKSTKLAAFVHLLEAARSPLELQENLKPYKQDVGCLFKSLTSAHFK